MKIKDLTEPMGPRMCMFNAPYGDEYYGDEDNYSSGYDSGYEKAKKEYEEKLENQKNELLARGFVSNTSEYAPKISAELDNFCKVEDVSPNYVGVNLNSLYNYDIPKQNNIPTGSKLCGYIEIDGTYHKCNSCEHEKFVRRLVYENEEFRNRYFELPASFFDKKPIGMLQEEYFLMKDLGVVKISSFKDAPTKMIAFYYNTLTYKQTDLIYPR